MKYTAFILFILSAVVSHATHNRAGEITYEQVGPLTIRMTITTYTKTSSQAADRDSLRVFWGDGSDEYVLRSNGTGQPLENDVKVNYYIKEHTYPGRGTYTIGFTDPNRVANILNVNWPNSVEVEFYLSTTFTFLDPQFQGTNSSAILLQAPIDQACVGKVFTHNPNAYDLDGDSLSYELAAPLMGPGMEVPGYVFPDEIQAGANNNLTLDPRTGDLVWDAPQIQGEYNVTIRINEWRNGYLINSILRDMQILVTACENDPPTIETEEEICVIAGELIDLDILVDDINGDLVRLEATGGPLRLTSDAAVLTETNMYKEVPFVANFTWQTNCNHVSKEYYQVVLKAEDNGFSDTKGLATLKTVRIKVTAPPPLNPASRSEDGGIRVSWENPYTCEVTDNEYFQGFSVWRKVGTSDFMNDTCQAGLTGSAYEKIVFNTRDIFEDRYSILDEEVEKGVTYCYRVQAEFAKRTPSGNPFNRVESLASEEVCQQLSRDLPLIVKNSIRVTDVEGSVDLHWTKPLAADLDTVENPGPYRYELYRSVDNGNAFEIIPDFTITTSTLEEPVDTTFLDTPVDTRVGPIFYNIHFYSRDSLVGVSSQVSSVFLSAGSQDKSVSLSWEADVPWSNLYYDIYKRNDAGDYELLTTTTEPAYVDGNLTNDREYCYYIKSYDTYGLSGVAEPLINDSQVDCVVPMDNVPPCPPVLSVSNICSPESPVETEEEAYLFYPGFEPDCNSIETPTSYNIYFRPALAGADYFLVENVSQEEFFDSRSNGGGCYRVTALDAVGNESDFSNEVCPEICPEYILPNTFTPNDDGNNDVFTPRVIRFISAVDFKVFNEWGIEIFNTDEATINWEGRDNAGRDLPEGTYFYTCVTYLSQGGDLEQPLERLSGYIHLIRD